MRHVMDTFRIKVKSKASKGIVIRTFTLVKMDNGDFRIIRGRTLITSHSIKYEAQRAFERFKNMARKEGVLI